jgi:hypothetical protein
MFYLPEVRKHQKVFGLLDELAKDDEMSIVELSSLPNIWIGWSFGHQVLNPEYIGTEWMFS